MPTRSSQIRFEFTGDASKASKALRELASEAARAGGITEDEAKRIGAAFDDIDRKAQGIDRAAAATAARGTAFGRLDQLAGGGVAGDFLGSLGGTEVALAGISTKAIAATAGVAGLGVAAVKAGQVSVGQFQSIGTSVAKFQQTLGGTTEDASRFWSTLSAVGVNPEQGLDALNQFAVNITQNRDDLDEFGVAVARFDDGSTDMVETLFNVIDAYQGMGDSAERARLLSVTLGEEGMRQLQPLIRRTTDELRDMGASAKNVLTEEDLRRLDEWNAAWGQFTTDVSLAAAAVGSDLVPVLSDVVDLAAPVVQGVGDVVGAFGELGSAVDEVNDVLETYTGQDWGGLIESGINVLPGGGVITGIARGAKAWLDHGEAQERAAAAERNYQANARSTLNHLAEEATAAQAASEAVDALAYSQQRQMDVSRQARAAGVLGELTADRAALADAQERAADVEADAARTIEAANQQAAQAIESANERVESAKQAWAEAAADLERAEADAARTIEDANRDAARSVSDANERVVQAREARTEAAEELAEAERDAAELIAEANEDASRRIVDAQERVTDAREAAARQQRDNARRVEDAEVALQDALNRALGEEDPGEAERIRSIALRDFERVREDVAESEIDAADDIREAEQGLVQAAQEAEEARSDAAERAADVIESAKDRVVEANERVTEAERGLRETTEDARRRVADAHRQAADGIQAAQSRVWQAASTVAQAEVDLRNVTAQAEADRAAAAQNAATAIWNARQVEIEANRLVEESERRLAGARMDAAAQLALFQATWNAQDPNNSLTRVTGQMPGVRRYHSGGEFRAPMPGGEGLAILRDREVVLTPQEVAGAGGVTTVINLNAPVYGDRRQLMEEIERAVREGYGTSLGRRQ
ncbi:MAG: hypothetical protein GEV08_07755 [Acidimicrobiia bacterium]|nr:hypothetical protein [Acidimicrobiia bacterium]